MSPHTHQIQHFCSDQQRDGVQGGVCASPETCLLEKAVVLLREAQKHFDLVQMWRVGSFNPVHNEWELRCSALLAAMESEVKSASSPKPKRRRR